MSKDEIQFYTMEATPEWAAEVLTLNTRNNRSLSEHRVNQLLKQMQSGEWLTTHEAVAFDKAGNLIDGQHRLTALVRFGKPLKITVAENCDPSTFRKIGQGAARSSADLFEIEYKERFGSSPASASYITAVASRMLSGVVHANHRPEEVAAHALRHYKKIREALGTLLGNKAAKSVLGTPTVAAMVRALLYFGEERITPLLQRLGTQSWTGQTDPLKVLYEKLLRAKVAEGRDRRSRLTQSEVYGCAVAAVRLCLAGKPATRLEGTSQDLGTAEIDKRIRNK